MLVVQVPLVHVVDVIFVDDSLMAAVRAMGVVVLFGLAMIGDSHAALLMQPTVMSVVGAAEGSRPSERPNRPGYRRPPPIVSTYQAPWQVGVFRSRR